MSANLQPQWTPRVIYPGRGELLCPSCQHPISKKQYLEVMGPLRGDTHYTFRHIPPELLMYCENSECEQCDEEFTRQLRLTVDVAK